MPAMQTTAAPTSRIVKNRVASVPAWIAAIEGIVMALLKAHLDTLDADGRKAFAERVAVNVGEACDDILAEASVNSGGTPLAPDMAKAVAKRIRDRALALSKDFEDEIAAQ